jgi:hypothetical protein
MMRKRQNFQPISWFWDLHQRGLLNLDPKYQRRSVWSQEFKDYFIDTILLGYPSPSIFLYEEIEPNGTANYNVVDGKQRLMTIFEFVANKFPIGEKAERKNLREKYFSQIDDDDKVALWGYQFSVEYIPTKEESIINNIFDRINRNVAKLTAQELRHARLDGLFIKCAEDLTEIFKSELPQNFPRFDPQSRRQMKDVEFTAQLLLLLELGPKGYSQDDLDKAFTDRDSTWDNKNKIESLFRRVVEILKNAIETPEGNYLTKTRLRNQADFYSLFGAIGVLLQENNLTSLEKTVENLRRFIEIVEDADLRSHDKDAMEYYEAARGASTDTVPRKKRIDTIKSIISDVSV